MDGNNTMEKLETKFVLLIVLFSFQGCTEQDPAKDEIIGTWTASDGARVELRPDGSYNASQIDYYSIYSEKEYKTKKLDFTGDWKIIHLNGKPRLKLQTNATFKDFGIDKTYTRDGQTLSHKLGLTFEISGEGILESNPPWHLFVWIGDPDDMSKYKFEKISSRVFDEM